MDMNRIKSTDRRGILARVSTVGYLHSMTDSSMAPSSTIESTSTGDKKHVYSIDSTQRDRTSGKFADGLKEKGGRTFLLKNAILEDELNQFFHSKVHDDPFSRSSIPYALRFRGSIFWSLVPQLVLVSAWATLIVCISLLKQTLAVSSVLITVLAFVTSLALSVRVNTAYERYNEGRKLWATLTTNVRNYARYVWVNVPIRQGREAEDLLHKVTVLKLMVGFAFALKHHLREELGIDYEDLEPYVKYLPTFARKRSLMKERERKFRDEERSAQEVKVEKRQSMQEVKQDFSGVAQAAGIELDKNLNESQVKFRSQARAASDIEDLLGSSSEKREEAHKLHNNNPRLADYLFDRADRISQSTVIHGNLPLEILNYIAYFQRDLVDRVDVGKTPSFSTFAAIPNNLTEVLTNTERILRTPLPLAYNIICNQLAWIFVMLLPFQLVTTLEWVAIPGTIIAGYVILGFAAIGLEIEDPFGYDPNDLDLDRYCQHLAVEVSMLMSNLPYSDPFEWMRDAQNTPLEPIYTGNFSDVIDKLDYADIMLVLQQMIEDPSVSFVDRDQYRRTAAGSTTKAQKRPQKTTLRTSPGIIVEEAGNAGENSEELEIGEEDTTTKPTEDAVKRAEERLPRLPMTIMETELQDLEMGTGEVRKSVEMYAESLKSERSRSRSATVTTTLSSAK
ncbi:Bestrophin, RFP-TM, chloride channel-domain-containing protein [Lipomyces oligophaga]|uniref:Bestrophin, RFP-TM, chloride channel-domain-containing protein n=1 Tax=Lipomyces oligophaga TaxID=45792 RepID=UPI0034CE66E1